MPEAAATAGIALVLLVGFALVALSQERHWETVAGPSEPPPVALRRQRALGFAAICLALPWCVATQGGGFGSLQWVVMTCAAAMAVALTLTWRPRWLAPLASLLRQPPSERR